MVINIDEKDKQEIDKLLKGRGLLLLDNAHLIKRAVLAIFHGKLLPKGHGDLIDRDALRESMNGACMGVMAGSDDYDTPLKTLDSAPTIIEADRSEE